MRYNEGFWLSKILSFLNSSLKESHSKLTHTASFLLARFESHTIFGFGRKSPDILPASAGQAMRKRAAIEAKLSRLTPPFSTSCLSGPTPALLLAVAAWTLHYILWLGMVLSVFRAHLHLVEGRTKI